MLAEAAETETERAPVVFEDVWMSFGDRPVLRGLTCEFPAGKITVVLGGSGSGKTTILRLIGGLVRPQRGRIFVNGEEVTALPESRMQRVRARLGMMFQGGALLDSLTIFDNLAFPLREHTRMSATEIAGEVHRILDAVGMQGTDHLFPRQLSGGMVKRAALARAILMHPQILLCDEPFSGLDPLSVKRIEALLERLNRDLNVTMLVASHHIPSTRRMADQVVLLWDHTATVGRLPELQSHPDPHIRSFFDEQLDELANEPEPQIDKPNGRRVV